MRRAQPIDFALVVAVVMVTLILVAAIISIPISPSLTLNFIIANNVSHIELSSASYESPASQDHIRRQK